MKYTKLNEVDNSSFSNDIFFDELDKKIQKIYFESSSSYMALEKMFSQYSGNNGFSSISNFMVAKNIKPLFYCSKASLVNKDMNIVELLWNLEILVNTIFSFLDHYSYSSYTDNNPNLRSLLRLIDNFIVLKGYKVLIDNKKYFSFTKNDSISIDITQADDETKIEIMNYFNFKSNLVDKKKIIVELATKLEPKRTEIEKKFGKNISSQLFKYFNKNQLRHNNLNSSDTNKYNSNIDDLTQTEFEQMYDYIFSFALNIHINLDSTKENILN